MIILLICFLGVLPAFSQKGAETETSQDKKEQEKETEEPAANVSPPSNVRAMDNPNDSGNQILVKWELAPEDTRERKNNPVNKYLLYRAETPDGAFKEVGKVAWGVNSLKDDVKNKKKYYYRLKTLSSENKLSEYSKTTEAAEGYGNWFNTDSINGLITVILFIGLIYFFMYQARGEGELFIRRIAGLDALDEAVGRATEMGKPILFVPGLGSMAQVATIAALNILGPVAKKVAKYDSDILVPNRNPIVFTVAQEVVQEAYMEAGKPDAYHDDMVFFVTNSQFGYAAAVDGIMVREKPATNLFLGKFWAESLILAETGNMTGAIQIAGTDSVTQLPFFVTACDYTIIGEELYAASAYLGRDPVLVSSLKAQDFLKGILIAFLTVGFAAGLVNTLLMWYSPDMALVSYLNTFSSFLDTIFKV